MKLWIWGAVGVGLGGAGVALWLWSRGSAAPASTASAGEGSAGRAEDERSAEPVPPVPSEVAPKVVEAPAPQGSPDLLAVVAGWARQRLYGCALAKARAPGGRGYIRFRVSPDFELREARLIDVGSGAEIADDCFERVFSGLKPRQSAAPDAGTSELTVWWPLRPGDGKEMVDYERPVQLQVPGVELMIVPYYYPIDWLPAGGLAGNWLGLCQGARQVTLSSKPNEENSDFVDVSVDGCGPDPVSVPVISKAGLSAKEQPALADVRAVAESPLREVDVRLGGDHYRLWSIDWETASGIRDGIFALRSGSTVQVLATEDSPGTLLRVAWAGDLDRDERIDLIIEGGGSDLSHYRLFLSNAQRTLPVLLAADRWLPGD